MATTAGAEAPGGEFRLPLGGVRERIVDVDADGERLGGVLGRTPETGEAQLRTGRDEGAVTRRQPVGGNDVPRTAADRDGAVPVTDAHERQRRGKQHAGGAAD